MQAFKGLMQRAWRVPLIQFTFFFVLILASRSAVADWNYVPTGSMKPTILEGDLVWVNRLAYDLKVPFTTYRLHRWDDPRRGDIVVAYSPESGERIIKRVVAIAGDVVELTGQSLIVNGQRPAIGPPDPDRIDGIAAAERGRHGFATETLLGHSRTVMYGPTLAPPSLESPYRVPPGHYFLVGDHRNNSRDSRYYGAVPRDQILGRATHVIGSIDIRGDWLPRWSRFFADMES